MSGPGSSSNPASGGEESELATSRQDEGLSGDAAPNMSLTSDEVNYLIYRYLRETGLQHSAFTFAYESMLARGNIIRNADRSIPPGALVSFLQKGLQYVAIEESLQRDNAEGKGQDPAGLTLLSNQTIATLTKDEPPIQLNVPPAAAAAAVKARLEVEAQLEASKKAAAVQAATEASSSLNGSHLAGPASIPPQAALETPSAAFALSARDMLSAQLAQQQSAVLRHGGVSSAGAAAFMARQQRAAAAELAALQEHRQAQLLQQADEQRMHQERARQELLNRKQQRALMQSSEATSTAASGLAMDTEPKGVKRALDGSKKAGKNKAKVAKPSKPASKTDDQVKGGSEKRISNSSGTSNGEDTGEASRVTAESQPVPMETDTVENAPASTLSEKNDLVNGIRNEPTSSEQTSETPKPNGDHPANPLDAISTIAAQEAERMELHVHKTPSKISSAQMERSENSDQKDKEDEATNAPPSEVLELRMHESEVFMCAWNPIFTDIIATGSGDASARIWHMGGPLAADGLGQVKLLPHGTGPRDHKNKDVTTLEWSPDGTLLATGSYDGVARVWSRNGALVHTLRGHKGPIFSLKWNKQGKFLLSGSYDKSTIVWDVSGSTGCIQQQFHVHDAPALDVDWRDDVTFASCSTDRTVRVCRVGTPQPLKTYSGHGDEVNAVKWDPSGRLLASCSDDCTAKVWDFTSDSLAPLHDLRSHKQEIYTVKWSPTGPGSPNPTKMSMLATASFDGSVRLWNVADGSCIQTFARHSDSVYSVAFSPSGDFLASGSLAGQLYIWNVADGRRVKSFKGQGDIFEVAWNKEETRVAACFSSNVVSVIDFKR